ncbi:hypothetical protein PR048_004772 [Dryococelus australis]|uniref:Uncharacterized protein n=1 Tax=Dryococelus australis TaxID=614101 RepID=A0ABQ9I6T6_9NEOP|nr:hypothetical protein PR048_004772 [Dryococelus australis]
MWVSNCLKKEDYAKCSLHNLRMGVTRTFVASTTDDLEYLLTLTEDKIRKDDTNCREAIPPRQKLPVAQRYIATGDSYASVMFLFRISKTAISKIIPEVCQALISFLRECIKARQIN